MVQVDLIVPLVPWLQHDLTALSHAAHVHALALAPRRLAQQLELTDERHHINECVIIGLEDEAHVVIGDRVLQYEIRLVQDALVVGLVVQECDVSILLYLLLHLHTCPDLISSQLLVHPSHIGPLSGRHWGWLHM